MICILHGYLLEGSGSNLWTRSVVESLCRRGETVHLVVQENHPERYPFITEARRYLPDGTTETFYRRDAGVEHPGCCILHKPVLGDTLPVYVKDRYEEFSNVVPMVDLSDDAIEEYLERNVRALTRIVRENGVTVMHANHAVLMSVVAQRVSAAEGIPFAVMPHGSALEYAVKRDDRFLRLATAAFTAASRIFLIGDEMRDRVRAIFTDVPDLDDKTVELHLGVDTSQFEPVPRAERPRMAARLVGALEGLPRGRTPAQTDALLAGLSGRATGPALAAALAVGQGYAGKLPDADVEARLATVDWGNDRTLLYVGRLISAKGVQEVVAALPLLLEATPELRCNRRGPRAAARAAGGHAVGAGARRAGRVRGDRGERPGAGGRSRGRGRRPRPYQGRALPGGIGGGRGLDAYFAAGRRHVRRDRVIFTGYLTHRELRYLFPCCDAAVFPSLVREAGPLVFLEALASGAFPLGTYFGGMKASIDALADALPPA